MTITYLAPALDTDQDLTEAEAEALATMEEQGWAEQPYSQNDLAWQDWQAAYEADSKAAALGLWG